jgi:tRNA modification GTPase
MRLCRLTDPATGVALDEALAVGFAAGASFTGTATVELHLHGSPAVTRAVLRALTADPALTPAEPGAFTRMAFETGRLTLPQVEALADLIDAETEAQRRQALAGLEGLLARAAEKWRTALVEARALVEAAIDFADEGIAEGTAEAGLMLADGVRAALQQELAGAAGATAVRQGFTVALLGPPNAGKSSLLNALARREAALVSPLPGTTRDVIEATVEIAGQRVTLLDTAGLRETGDALEAMGIERARARARAADLRLLVSAPGLPAPQAEARPGDIAVANKADLGRADGLPVSALTGAGLDALVAAVAERLGERVQSAGLAAHFRQQAALARAAAALDIAPDTAPEIVAEGLREATQALDSLIGRVDIEEVLGTIFARFCIGK